VLLCRLKRYAEALADFDRALALAAEDPRPVWRLRPRDDFKQLLADAKAPEAPNPP
jgi:hypothetical protein